MNASSSKRTKQPKNDRTSKEEKTKQKNVSQDFSARKEATDNIQNRSTSLNRKKQSRINESPQKSHSIDRTNSNKIIAQNSLKSTPAKKQLVSSFKPSDEASTSKTSSKKKTEHHSKANLQDKESVKTQKSSSKIHKTSKTNLQIAKSFVENTESPQKMLKKKKEEIAYSINSDISNKTKKDKDHRPQTSTIHKGPVNSNTNVKEVEKNDIDLKKQHRSRSKSRVSQKSEEDKDSYADDFEEYDSDFEDSSADSDSESDSDIPSGPEDMEHSDSAETYNIISNESTIVKTSDMDIPLSVSKKPTGRGFLNMSDRSSLLVNEEPVQVVKPMKISRSFINFESALLEEKKNQENDLMASYNDLEKFEANLAAERDAISLNYQNKLNQRSNFKQVSVQTEALEEQEVQTDEIETMNKWSQMPTNSTLGCGGDQISATQDNIVAWKSLFNVHSTKLSSFLDRASHVILTLLDEEFTPNIKSLNHKKRPNFFQSDGYYKMSPIEALSGAPILNVHCLHNSPYILTVHSNAIEVKLSDTGDTGKGIVCVWNLQQNKRPEYVLTSNSNPTCASFGPGAFDMVIGGMVDGAIMLWDLTELDVNAFGTENEAAYNFRFPTYNTALVNGNDGHRSCIVTVRAVHSPINQETSANFSRGGNTRNFHVMTLEDLGVLNIWIVVEVFQTDLCGQQSDLGLAPGGKFRLVKSASIQLSEHSFLQTHQKTNIRTFDFLLFPGDSSRMLVTTDAGIVLHASRHHSNTEPRAYKGRNGSCPELRCIERSPFCEDLFLVGCNDGSVKLYNVSLSLPLLELPHAAKGESVSLLQWSVSNPSEFYVLSDSSHLFLWNLMKDLTNPVQSYQFQEKVTWFLLKEAKKAQSNSGCQVYNMIIAQENGELEVHICEEKFSKEEFSKQMHFLQNL